MFKPVYFTLAEMLASTTAVKKKIANLPSWEVIENLRQLGLFLDGVREAWGSGIIVSSGFRCPALNKAVGGVDDSEHQYGCAADIKPSNGKFNQFVDFLKDWLVDKEFDKCIIEKSKTSRWIHIVWKSHQGYQRKKLFTMDV